MNPVRLMLALVLALGLLAFAGQAQDKKPAAKPEEKVAALSINQLRDKLSVLGEAELDAMPLREAVAFFQQTFGLTIVIDTEAFKTDLQIAEVENQQVKLPRLRGVKLETLLRKVISQVNGVLLFRPGHLEVTTPQRLVVEAGRELGNVDVSAGLPPALRLPLVQAEYDQRPLGEILKETADWTGATIVLDPRARDKAKEPLTVTLRNVPVDTAVRLLADIADLKFVTLDAVHYVTTKDNAKTLQAEELKRRQQAELNPFMPGPAR